MAKWLKLFKVLSRALVACGSEPHFSIGCNVFFKGFNSL